MFDVLSVAHGPAVVRAQVPPAATFPLSQSCDVSAKSKAQSVTSRPAALSSRTMKSMAARAFCCVSAISDPAK